MILYFSGTGNSQHVAQKIAEKTDDELISINHLLKQKNRKALSSTSKPFVFVCPTYAWRIPRVVEQFIRNTTFEGGGDVYFVMTCGGQTAESKRYISKLCDYKGWRLLGFAEILMPDNYILMFPSLEKETAITANRNANAVIMQVAENIRDRKEFSVYKQGGMMDKLESSLINRLFYPLMVKSKGFYATDKCIGCGKCAEVCALNNIILKDKKPVWGSYCTHCMACICECPAEAIEYKNKTQGKTRYLYKNFQ